MDAVKSKLTLENSVNRKMLFFLYITPNFKGEPSRFSGQLDTSIKTDRHSHRQRNVVLTI